MTTSDGEKNKDLNIWLARVKQAQTSRDIFRILDEFRKYEWTDVQCQMMSHLYIRMIDLMPPEEMEVPVEVASVSIADDTATGASVVAASAVGAETDASREAKKAVINEGPVWYEKM